MEKKNLERANSYTRANYAKNIEKSRDRCLQKAWRKNGVDISTISRPKPLLCECCLDIPKGTLHLDHCHATGKFRGWICMSCNTGIGHLGDHIDAVRKALKYLEKYS
jgi:Recombination endonuclease VII